MSKTKRDKIIIIDATNQRNRDPFFMHAGRRVAVTMKDRRTERGGTKNLQRQYREEA